MFWRNKVITPLAKSLILATGILATFFNLTFATSLLVPLSALLYAIFKWDTMLSDVPRVTIFWRNKVITPLAKFLILATGILVAAHLLLTILGRMSSNYCEPPVILHGSFSPSPFGSQLSCHPSFKPSQQGRLTCAWFFGPQGVVDISPIFYEEHHHVIILRSYSTLACVPLGQGQVISPLPTKSSSISVQGDGNREMLFIFLDLMERRARLHMDEEESR